MTLAIILAFIAGLAVGAVAVVVLLATALSGARFWG